LAITTFVRKEKKYLITAEQREKLLERLPEYMEFDKHCRNGKFYIVNNVYFDTPTFNVIRHSTSKPKYKEKIRMRCYKVEVEDDDLVFLEIKKKFLGVVNKRRVHLPLKVLETFLVNGVRPDDCTVQQTQIFNELEYIMKVEDVAPRVYLSYVRYAMFAKEDSSVRLTIDDDILARCENPTLRSKRYGKQLLPQGHYLMEIKINGAFPLWLAHLLTELKIYPTSFSKYGRFYESIVKEKKI